MIIASANVLFVGESYGGVMRNLLEVAFSLGVFALLGLFGCGGEQAESTEPSGSNQDPAAEPVSDGSWYQPEISTTWQWQLVGTVNASYDVDVYDIDLFDNDASVIADLQAAGHVVVCYFSAGSSEDWREDFSLFDSADLGAQLDDWEGEKWLDITSDTVRSVMLGRLELAAQKGCDGVEPDNVDGWTNETGFALTAEHQLAFNRFLANEAHDRGLAVLLKNDGDQAEALVNYFDGSLNEECHLYDECDQLAPFTEAGKPIFNAEYPGSESEAAAAEAEVCASAAAANTRTLLLPMDLDDSFRFSCD